MFTNNFFIVLFKFIIWPFKFVGDWDYVTCIADARLIRDQRYQSDSDARMPMPDWHNLLIAKKAHAALFPVIKHAGIYL
jgi:hypothetical protein